MKKYFNVFGVQVFFVCLIIAGAGYFKSHEFAAVIASWGFVFLLAGLFEIYRVCCKLNTF